jgi:small-conductance mechanosensitive channel
MSFMLDEIESSLIDLIRQWVALIPALGLACLVLVMTRFLASFASRITALIAIRALHSRSLQKLTFQLTRFGVWFLGVIIASVIVIPDLSIADVIGFLGFGSVAVGFAFQDIFKNFLAGVLLLIAEPFQLGDEIIVNGYEGTVETIEIRSTKIRTYQGETVDIPNSLVFTNPVKVLTACKRKRTDLLVGVEYDTQLSHAQALFLETLKTIEGVLVDPVPLVHLSAFAPNSIDFTVRYWTLPQRAQVVEIQSRVILAIKGICDQHQITLAHPICIIYTQDSELS